MIMMEVLVTTMIVVMEMVMTDHDDCGDYSGGYSGDLDIIFL